MKKAIYDMWTGMKILIPVLAVILAIVFATVFICDYFYTHFGDKGIGGMHSRHFTIIPFLVMRQCNK